MFSLRPWLSAVAVLAGTLLAVAPAHARGSGHNLYLLSPDGKFLRQIDDLALSFDPTSGLIFDTDEVETIVAKSPTGGPALWTVPYPFPKLLSRDHSYMAPGVLLLTDSGKGILVGIDKTSGKELYRLSLGRLRLAQPYAGSHAWPMDLDAESRFFGYLVEDLVEDRKVVGIKTLSRFDIRTGRRTWERELAPEVGRGLAHANVLPGEVRRGGTRYYFDPQSGEPLSKIPTAADKMSDLLCHGKTIFHLSSGDPAKLTVYEQGTQRSVWSVGELAGVRRICTPYAWERLLLASPKEMVVVDTRRKKVLSRFAVNDPSEASIVQAEDSLLVAEPKTVRAIDPETGKLMWDRQVEGFCGEVKLTSQGTVLYVEYDGTREQYKARTLVAVSLKDGAVRWRWTVPDREFARVIGAVVYPTRSGLVIWRNWSVN